MSSTREEVHCTPRHIALIPDGNRRWARARGLPVADGFRHGAAKIPEVLGWCEQADIGVVTVWMMSVHNLARSPAELEAMLSLVASTVDKLAGTGRWRLRLVGSLDLLPASTVARLRAAETATSTYPGMLVNLAIAYSGRQDIVSAVREYLRGPEARHLDGGEIARIITVEAVDGHLTTHGQPDPDLVVRTSGEQRMSGFMGWQAGESELYFCDQLWPDFTEGDLAKALESYRWRQRRFGL